MSERGRKLLWLTFFALAMAQVEASIVIYLRDLYYPGHPLQLFPLALLSHRDLVIELVRELATVVMILAVALLSVRGPVRVFSAFVYVFGWWDLFYYLWLKILLGWPVSWREWDVLYLIPWPWFGPWLTPALIALLFVLWGGWALMTSRQVRFTRGALLLFLLGTGLALAAFLLPGAMLLPRGEAAFRGYQPQQFCWLLYGPGLMLMAAGLWRASCLK
ncbi:MAG: hypothetical protein P8Z67_11455 [Gammaproteobacteria bacterium]